MKPLSLPASSFGVLAAVLVLTLIGGAQIASPPALAQPAQFQSPLLFEENAGQTDSRVRYFTRFPGGICFLTKEEMVTQVGGGRRNSGPIPHPATNGTGKPSTSAVIRTRYLGASSSRVFAAEQPSVARVNYYRGSSSSQWIGGIQTFRRVRLENLFPHIDVEFHGNSKRQFEHDFVVHPGGDPAAIRLQISGFNAVHIDDATGDLVFDTAAGEVRQLRPVAYQTEFTHKRFVDARYRMVNHGEKAVIGLEVGDFDRERELVIDPVLQYAGYLGGSEFDSSSGIAVDASGAAYLTGTTRSPDFPTTEGYRRLDQNDDIYVVKYSKDGETLEYSAFIDGIWSGSIAFDTEGAAYVTGAGASGGMPIVGGKDGVGALDVFLLKLSPRGDAIDFSTFIGGRASDYPKAAFLDAGQNLYVFGTTQSNDFPTTNGAFRSFAGGYHDLFVLKFSFSSRRLVYSTYLGGDDIEDPSDLVVDSSGRAFVCGITGSDNFPNLNAFQKRLGGERFHGFITCFSADGRSIVFSTNVGGLGDDWPLGIALDSTGGLYLTGSTYSSDFPVRGSYYPFPGKYAGFVCKFNLATRKLEFGTFMDSRGFEAGYRIGLLPNRTIVVTGSATQRSAGSVDFGPGGGRSDGLIWMLPAIGAPIQRCTIGGSGYDWFPISVLDFDGSVFLAGDTSSPDLPVTGYPRPTANSSVIDGYIAKITVLEGPASPSGLNASRSLLGDEIQLTWADSSADETGFTVYRRDGALCFRGIANLPANSVSFIDAKVANDTRYTYQVRARRGKSHSLPSNEAAVERLFSEDPTLLKAEATYQPTRVALSWKDNSDEEYLTHIYRRDASAGYALLARVAGGVTQFVDRNVLGGATYSYYVKAWDARRGSSEYSNAVLITLATIPKAPGTPKLELLPGSRAIRVTWADHSDNEERFELFRKRDSEAWIKIGETSSNQALFVDSDAGPGHTYYYKVRGVNVAGPSAYSPYSQIQIR